MSFVTAALIGSAGALGGGFLASKGAKSAAKKSAKSQMEAAQLADRQAKISMLQNILLNAPAVNSQNIARSELAGMLGLRTPATDYRKAAQLVSPGYKQGAK